MKGRGRARKCDGDVFRYAPEVIISFAGHQKKEAQTIIMKRLVARESFRMIGESMGIGSASRAKRIFRLSVKELLPLIDHHKGRGLHRLDKPKKKKRLGGGRLALRT